MHQSIQNLINIQKIVKSQLPNFNDSKLPRIIAVSKTFEIDKILPLIEYGHMDFGENKLHLIGKLQTNKVKFAINLFDYIHSLDNEKLAKKIADEEFKQKKKVKIFIQVNIGNEKQKSGINTENLESFYNYCIELNLDIVGLMCIPPIGYNSENFFKEMNILTKKLNFKELSMGMSSDYINATKNHSTYLRIGSAIFGNRN